MLARSRNLLTALCIDGTISCRMPRKAKSRRSAERMLMLRDAALQLGISFPTIKQWIYKKKIRSIQTAGGHHRIPQSEVDKLLFRTRGSTEKERKLVIRRERT